MDANKRTSVVWKHFDLVDDNKKTQCRLCQIKIAYGSSTSSMKNHLKFKHPLLCPDPMTSTASSNTKKQTQLQFTKKLCPMTKEKWQEITKSIVEFCATDMRPLSVVNGTGFQNMLSKLDPSYHVPSHTTIRNYTSYCFDGLKEVLKKELRLQPSIALTTDAWTSCATEGYLTITCHYIDKNWQLHHNVLTTSEIHDRHTGENLASMLQDQIGQYDIPENKIAGVSTDNGSNIVSCMNILGWPHIRCFGHTLQLGVNSGLALGPIAKAAGAGRKVATHFRKSTLSADALKKKQSQLDLPAHALLQDVSTRWNSTYFMFKRLLEQRLAIFAVIHDERITKPADARVLELSDQVWKVMEDITPLLKPLQMATAIVCSEEYPTLSMIYPIVAGLLHNHLAVSDTDSKIVADFKKAVKTDLSKRYKANEELHEQPYIIAAALDPRYKSLKFLSDADNVAVWDFILSLLNTNDEPEAELGALGGESVAEPACKRTKLDESMEYLMGNLYEGTDNSTTVLTVDKEYEIKSYRAERIARDINPVNWWRLNAFRFPSLAPLARKFLGIPGTSVPSERIFSAAGNIVTKKRASLDPDTVNELIFIRENFRDQRKQRESENHPSMLAASSAPSTSTDYYRDDISEPEVAVTLPESVLPHLPDVSDVTVGHSVGDVINVTEISDVSVSPEVQVELPALPSLAQDD